MDLEIFVEPDDVHIIIKIFYSDVTRDMTMTFGEPDVPLEVVEWAMSEAREMLPAMGDIATDLDSVDSLTTEEIEHLNKAGQEQLHDILYNPRSEFTRNESGGLDVYAPDGRGARFTASGDLLGFRDR